MNTHIQHQSLANGRWAQFSLAEQLGNIGSEISRALHSRGDNDKFDRAVVRALELFDLTIRDARWKKQLKEITRAREVFCDLVFGENQYDTSLEDLDRYFYYFAYLARARK